MGREGIISGNEIVAWARKPRWLTAKSHWIAALFSFMELFQKKWGKCSGKSIDLYSNLLQAVSRAATHHHHITGEKHTFTSHFHITISHHTLTSHFHVTITSQKKSTLSSKFFLYFLLLFIPLQFAPVLHINQQKIVWMRALIKRMLTLKGNHAH